MSYEEPLVNNAANKSQVKDAAKTEKLKRDRELRDVHHVLSTREGRRFYWRYLCECRIFQSSFNNSGSVTYFNEGKRDVGLKLLSEMDEAAPESYLLMLKESKEIQ